MSKQKKNKKHENESENMKPKLNMNQKKNQKKKSKKSSVPVMMAVRLEASMPSVTCSAVEADPNPLGPGKPVIKEKIPTISLSVSLFHKVPGSQYSPRHVVVLIKKRK